MSKIRVYDLAKEAGIKSTELAEKLIDLGYNIKGHSSSVEDEVADEIRRNVLGTVETEVVEKRICTKGRATIIRRRSQTVRRAAETVPPRPASRRLPPRHPGPSSAARCRDPGTSAPRRGDIRPGPGLSDLAPV